MPCCFLRKWQRFFFFSCLFFFALAGNKPDTLECTLRREDVSEKHFINVTSSTPGSSFKSCSPQQQQSDSKEFHIINIPENVGPRWESSSRSARCCVSVCRPLASFCKILCLLFFSATAIFHLWWKARTSACSWEALKEPRGLSLTCRTQGSWWACARV